MYRVLLNNHKNIHFIGIGGISMSGLAEILHTKGFRVTGSDVSDSEIVTHLKEIGISVSVPHSEENLLTDTDLVVYTAAIKEDNPEMVKAKALNMNIIDRACLLGNMMNDYDCPICVSGTHGKTSTTSMITEILLTAGKNPTASVGGIVPKLQKSFQIGSTNYIVVESCEYFDGFLQFFPQVGVILNIEADHLDYFKNLEAVETSFHKFAENIRKGGTLVINNEMPSYEVVVSGLSSNIITFGNENADCFAKDIVYDLAGNASFKVVFKGDEVASISLKVIGEHNVKNALAAFATAYSLGIETEKIVEALNDFAGAKRRFEQKGMFNGGAIVVDDYAHHPTEIMATLSGAKNGNYRKVYCAFQPHTYTRTYNLLDEFSNSFKDADEIIILDIYPAREPDTGLIHSKDLAERIRQNDKEVKYFSSFSEAKKYFLEHCVPNDLLITMGAGDVYLLGDELLST